MPEGLKAHTLTPDRYGVRQEGIPLTTEFIEIDLPSGHHVSLKTETFRRSGSPIAKDDEIFGEMPHQREGQAVILSGFGTRSQDWPIAFEGLGRHFRTVVGFDHPEAPSSKITGPDTPLNGEDFSNSGYAIYRGIEAKIKDKTLTAGFTAFGMSTGTPVILEALRIDAEMAKMEGRDAYFGTLVLVAPAGMQDRGNFKNIEAGASAPFSRYLNRDYRRDLELRQKAKKEPKINDDHATPKQSGAERWERLKEVIRRKDWRGVLPLHLGFEAFEVITDKLPMDDLKAFIHRVWPDQDPHFLPNSRSVKHNQELIWQNITENARKDISGVDIFIELYENDGAVPPEGFLSKADISEIAQATLTHEDYTTLRELNDRRLEASKKTRQPIDEYDDAWMLENKKQEMTLDRIVANVKALFPENGNRTHVSINVGGDHITPKVDADLFIDLLTRRMDHLKDPLQNESPAID
jgi:hypothetical protein